MDAAYYRKLVQDLMAKAGIADHPTIAARFRERAHEYRVIAEALEDAKPSQPPRQEAQRPAQQQQQAQRKPNKNKPNKDKSVR